MAKDRVRHEYMIQVWDAGDLLAEGSWKPYFYTGNFKEGGGIHGRTDKKNVEKELHRIQNHPYLHEQGKAFRMVHRKMIITTTFTDWEEV